MLYSFFITQWNNPCKGDWVELVKKDLKDFEIPVSFEYIQSKSKDAFKKIVQVKAKELALARLLTKQSKHTKLDKLNYKELKMQDYLLSEELKPNQKKLLFKYRTRMAEYGENYRAGRTQVMCPLCKLHLDNQEMSYQCEAIKAEITVTGRLENIFEENISVETAQMIMKITEVRKLILENKKMYWKLPVWPICHLDLSPDELSAA